MMLRIKPRNSYIPGKSSANKSHVFQSLFSLLISIFDTVSFCIVQGCLDYSLLQSKTYLRLQAELIFFKYFCPFIFTIINSKIE